MIMAIENEEECSFVENLYHKYKRQMMNICMSILKNPEDAQDALSDTFERIIMDVNRFMDAEHLEGLIMVTTKNVACYHYNRKKKMNLNEATSLDCEEGESDVWKNLEDSEVDLDQVLLDREFINEIKRLLKALPSDVCAIVIYKYLYHYSNTEIAQMMRIDRGAVNLKLFRAKNKLKKLLIERYLKQ